MLISSLLFADCLFSKMQNRPVYGVLNRDPSTLGDPRLGLHRTEKSKTQLMQVLVHLYTNCYHHQNTIAINVNGLFIVFSLSNYAIILVVHYNESRGTANIIYIMRLHFFALFGTSLRLPCGFPDWHGIT